MGCADIFLHCGLRKTLLLLSIILMFFATKGRRHSIHGDLLTQNIVKKGVRVHKDYIHRLVFVVAIKNQAYIESLVLNISNPNHVDYGLYLDANQLADLLTHKSNTDNVISYLAKHGCFVEKKSLHGEYIAARASVGLWEELLQATFHEYTHERPDRNGKKTARIVVGADSYAIPADLEDSVVGVMNVLDVLPPYAVTPILQPIDSDISSSSGTESQSINSNLRGPNRGRVDISANGQASRSAHVGTQATVVYDGFVRPALLNAVYNITNNTGSPYTSQALYATNQNTLSLSDLSAFQRSFSLPSQTISNIGGRISDTVCTTSISQCATPNVAIQYMTALSQQTPTLFYYSDLTWDSFLVELASMADPPKVLALTYVSDEWSTSTTVKNAFLQEAIKLAARGVTLVVAAGDDGAPGHTVRSNSRACGYYPLFPATVPYVVAVGATMGPASSATAAEISLSAKTGGAATSGGGFSSFYALPSFQQAHVSSYLAANSPPLATGAGGAGGLGSVGGLDGVWGVNGAGRGYPDVSLLGHMYVVVIGGGTYGASGSATAAAAFAGMVSLLNSRRKRGAGNMGEVGFLNSLLYNSYPVWQGRGRVRDIQQGDNQCTGSASRCCSQGYVAAAGWDAVTGLGSVDVEGLWSVISRELVPSQAPSASPSITPSASPSLSPSTVPSMTPSTNPSIVPSPVPSISPSLVPSLVPSRTPSTEPSQHPTTLPTVRPTVIPTAAPTRRPSCSPSAAPTTHPTTTSPSPQPTPAPTNAPTVTPTRVRTARPSPQPTASLPRPVAYTPSARPLTPTAAYTRFIPSARQQRSKSSDDKDGSGGGRVKVVTPRPVVYRGRGSGNVGDSTRRRFAYKTYEVHVN